MRLRPTLALALVASTIPLAAVTAAPPAPQPWRGSSSMLGGTARYDGGEWIYQDFVYDDYGASSPEYASGTTSLAPTSGDARYPGDGDVDANNTADIAEVRVRDLGADLEVGITLTTLVDRRAPVVGIAVDRGAPAAVKAWPYGAGVRSAWDHFYTVAPGNAAVDLAANTLTLKLGGMATGDEVRLTVGSGLWDRAADAWTAEGVFDLAFNTRAMEPRSASWMEDAQAATIAGGDVTALSQTIDLRALAARRTDRAITAPGYYNRVFRSRMTLGEGVADDTPMFRSPLQPYALWLPKGYDPAKPAPLVLNLHSLSMHHNQYADGTTYEQVADRLGAIVVTPLGRGPDGWYTDEALVDTLEVWNDVRRHHRIDDARTQVWGYSMGGYGTYRLTTLLPDRFASAISVVGPPVDGIWAWPVPPTSGDEHNPDVTYHQLESTEHVPFMIVHGTNDELVPVTGVTHQAERFRELGYEHRYHLHPGQDHLSFSVLDEWSREAEWFAGHRARVSTPGHVAFDVRPRTWMHPEKPELLRLLRELVAGVGGDLDSSYWVRDVAVRGAGGDDVSGVVDLTSGGIAARVPVTTPVDGFDPGGSSPHAVRGLDRTWQRVPVANTLSGRVSAVRELTIDLRRAGLRLDGLRVDVDTDGPVLLHLVDGSRKETRRLSGGS